MNQNGLAARLRLLGWGAGQVLKHGRPTLALGFLGGVGDDLLCTAPIEEWRRRGAHRIWFHSRHPDLYRFRDRTVSLIPDDPRYQRLALRLGQPMRALSYSTFDPASDRDTPLAEHIIVAICRNAGLQGKITLRPHLHLDPAETASAAAWRDCVPVQSGGLAAAVPMRNKQWRLDRFQAVARHLTKMGQRVVQIGAASDPALDGVEDLRGRTSLRQTAAILSGARLFIGLSGFLMHLARAVECPAVIVYGGREPPELTGYVCNINVTGRPPCAPCWQRNRCDHDHICMEAISENEVVTAVTQALARSRGPLTEETAVL